jgi:hypothetical protein
MPDEAHNLANLGVPRVDELMETYQRALVSLRSNVNLLKPGGRYIMVFPHERNLRLNILQT